jgi:hypothetical protein
MELEKTMSWKERLKLNEGEELKFISKFEAGNLGQKERYSYEIVNSQGAVTGKVKYVEHTSIKAPFSETFTLHQYDLDENEVLFERW